MNETPFISESEFDACSDCRQAEVFLHRYVEGELDPIRSQLLSAHLESCASCRSARRELERERLWLIEGAVNAPPLSEHFREKVLARLRNERAEALQRRRSDIFFRATGAAAAVLILAFAAFQSLDESGSSPEAARETAKVVFTSDSGAGSHAPPSLAAQLVSLPPSDIQDALEEPTDCIEDEVQESDIDVDPAVTAGADSSRGAGAPVWGSKLGNVARMAAELDVNATLPRWLPIAQDDPCRPDPNQDGKAGWDDVAILCQAIIRGAPEHFLDGGHESALVEDCWDLCVRRLERRVEFGS